MVDLGLQNSVLNRIQFILDWRVGHQQSEGLLLGKRAQKPNLFFTIESVDRKINREHKQFLGEGFAALFLSKIP